MIRQEGMGYLLKICLKCKVKIFEHTIASQAVGELIQIATNKSKAEDYNSKHKEKAKYGWYRYDTRLGLPVYNLRGEIERYNIFKLRMLVRHDADGKLYLYDFLRTKKETSSPLE